VSTVYMAAKQQQQQQQQQQQPSLLQWLRYHARLVGQL
jgi:hypothetical protein